MARAALDYEKNRLSYLELLRPEEGYQVDFAVCMTYSLGFDALIGGLLSFDAIEDPNSNVSKEEIYLLDCIQRNASKVAVFCNAGNIKLPRKRPELYHMLLENSVFQVLLGNKINFHPKLWVVRYEDDFGDAYFNIIVLSRNLTFDSSLDVAIRFTGKDRSEGRINQEVVPLVDMLSFVADYASEVVKGKVLHLAEQLQYIKRLETGKEYDEVAFLPYGFYEYKDTAAKEYSEAKEIVVVSPFLSEQVSRLLTKDAKKATLITRKYSLNQKIYEMFSSLGGVWILREELLDDSVLEEKTENIPERRDIHAKIIYEKMYDDISYLYLGSLNASSNSFYRNIELMVRLRYREGQMSYKRMLSVLLPENNNPFEMMEEFSLPGETEETEDDMELFDVISAATDAIAISKDGNYEVQVAFSPIQSPAEIAMYGRSGEWKAVDSTVTFDNISLKELSSLFIVRRGSLRKVIIIPVRNIPLEERNAAIVRSIIDTTDKLLSYITIMMSDDYVLDCRQIKELEKARNKGGSSSADPFAAVIYEKLLRLSAMDPDRLKYIKNQIEILEKDKDPGDIVRSILDLIRTCEKAVDRGTIYYED